MVTRVTVKGFDKMADRIGRRVETLLHESLQDIGETLVRRTPVDTGFLRASWFVSLNDPSPVGGEVRVGAGTVARLNLGVSQAALGDTVYFVNQAKYAPVVERGTSKQAPQGFVRPTVLDAPQIIEETSRRIARK